MTSTNSFMLALLLLALTLATTTQAQLGRQQGLLDPNVAPEKELTGLPHLNADLAKQIVAQRPLLSITNLNALLAKSLKPEQLTELYRKTFGIKLGTELLGEISVTINNQDVFHVLQHRSFSERLIGFLASVLPMTTL